MPEAAQRRLARGRGGRSDDDQRIVFLSRQDSVRAVPQYGVAGADGCARRATAGGPLGWCRPPPPGTPFPFPVPPGGPAQPPPPARPKPPPHTFPPRPGKGQNPPPPPLPNA